MLNLNTVMICSEDPQALSAFYTKVLGEPGWQDSGYVGKNESSVQYRLLAWTPRAQSRRARTIAPVAAALRSSSSTTLGLAYRL